MRATTILYCCNDFFVKSVIPFISINSRLMAVNSPMWNNSPHAQANYIYFLRVFEIFTRIFSFILHLYYNQIILFHSTNDLSGPGKTQRQSPSHHAFLKVQVASSARGNSWSTTFAAIIAPWPTIKSDLRNNLNSYTWSAIKSDLRNGLNHSSCRRISSDLRFATPFVC